MRGLYFSSSLRSLCKCVQLSATVSLGHVCSERLLLASLRLESPKVTECIIPSSTLSNWPWVRKDLSAPVPHECVCMCLCLCVRARVRARVCIYVQIHHRVKRRLVRSVCARALIASPFVAESLVSRLPTFPGSATRPPVSLSPSCNVYVARAHGF